MASTEFSPPFGHCSVQSFRDPTVGDCQQSGESELESGQEFRAIDFVLPDNLLFPGVGSFAEQSEYALNLVSF